jgi:DNA replication protein DnaD
MALTIWSVTWKHFQYAVTQIKNETIRDDDNTMTNGEFKPSMKQLEQQTKLYSLALSAPSIADTIKARQMNIEQRFTRIVEFKRATPKEHSSRFHQNRQNQKKRHVTD